MPHADVRHLLLLHRAWNLVRTVTSTAAFGCLVAAAMMYRSAK